MQETTHYIGRTRDLLRFTHAKVNRTRNNYYVSPNASFCMLTFESLIYQKCKSWQKGNYQGNPGIMAVKKHEGVRLWDFPANGVGLGLCHLRKRCVPDVCNNITTVAASAVFKFWWRFKRKAELPGNNYTGVPLLFKLSRDTNVKEIIHKSPVLSRNLSHSVLPSFDSYPTHIGILSKLSVTHWVKGNGESTVFRSREKRRRELKKPTHPN